jgi:hypothetical protein
MISDDIPYGPEQMQFKTDEKHRCRIPHFAANIALTYKYFAAYSPPVGSNISSNILSIEQWTT